MPQVSGLTPQPASTATCSTSFDKPVASSTSVMSLRKPVAFSICRVSISNCSQGDPSGQLKSAHRNQHGGCSTCQNPLEAPSLKSISANVALRRCTKQNSLRFHPRCYYRPDADTSNEVWPALIAAVTDLAGNITGAHRTWLDPSGNDKAAVDTPRRAMGHLLGHGVRFGVPTDIMAAGEGLETMLSLRSALPTLPTLAALSAHHLAAILFPATLRRLYVARDRDPSRRPGGCYFERARTVSWHRGAHPLARAG